MNVKNGNWLENLQLIIQKANMLKTAIVKEYYGKTKVWSNR